MNLECFTTAMITMTNCNTGSRFCIGDCSQIRDVRSKSTIYMKIDLYFWQFCIKRYVSYIRMFVQVLMVNILIWKKIMSRSTTILFFWILLTIKSLNYSIKQLLFFFSLSFVQNSALTPPCATHHLSWNNECNVLWMKHSMNVSISCWKPNHR